MSDDTRPCSLGDLVDYLLGELPAAAESELEEHLFGCPACGEALESVERIATAVGAAVQGAEVGANVTGAFLEQALADGLSLREYRLAPGQTVECSAGREDYFVVRLAVEAPEVGGLTLHGSMEDLDSGGSQPLPEREVERDEALGEVLLVFPGSVVRTYPRSLWTLTVESSSGSRLGPYVLDHAP